MRNKISNYEFQQVEQYLNDAYSYMGRNVDREVYHSEGWIVYLNMKKRYTYLITNAAFWDIVMDNLISMVDELCKIRNNKITLESNLSLNKSYVDTGEEIITIIPGKTGDFVNGIAFWDYAKRLGKMKYSILKLMSEREDDIEIMKKLYLRQEEYFELKLQLREDFQQYLAV